MYSFKNLIEISLKYENIEENWPRLNVRDEKYCY